MSEITPYHFLIPGVAVVLAVMWMCYAVKEKGQDILELTSKQNVGEAIQPVDIFEKQQREKGNPPIDREKFNYLYYRKLYKLRRDHPITAFVHNITSPIPKKYLDGIEEEIQQEKEQLAKKNAGKKQE